MTKSTYKTEQRKDLLKYLEKNSDRFVSAVEIQNEFSKKKINIGLTTIYRFLNTMENEGKVRYELKNHTKYYQYISEKCNSHYHLQCKKCGKLIHLECDEVKTLKKHILEEHDFEIDSSSPIIGICEKCNK